MVLTPSGLNASEQAALYVPEGNWWLLSGPALLMRPTRASFDARLELESPQGTQVYSLLDRDDAGRLKLPPPRSTPVFLVAGSPEVVKDTIDGVRIRYISDAGAGLDSRAVLKAHGQGIAYINSLVPGRTVISEHPRALDVIWIGISPTSGMIGGAAGFRSLVVNYLYGSEDDTPAFRKLPVVVLFHEQCHSLFDGLPFWMTESLSQHYAFKVLDEVGLMDKETRNFIRTRFAVCPEDAPTILEVYRDILQTKDHSHYGIFYTQGSAFWREVDETITRHSGGKCSLDDVLPELMSLHYDPEGGLPSDFARILKDAGGNEMVEILTKHLGT
jgi:hypothetical protein